MKSENIFEKIKKQADKKNRNVVYEAIETITQNIDRIQFMKLLIEFYKTEPEIMHDPYNIALSNVGYALGYYERKLRESWYNDLDQFKLVHPIFGSAKYGDDK